jgi:hypothetical protein
MHNLPFKLSIGAAACLGIYALGALSDRHSFFPLPQIISFREQFRADSNFGRTGLTPEADTPLTRKAV